MLLQTPPLMQLGLHVEPIRKKKKLSILLNCLITYHDFFLHLFVNQSKHFTMTGSFILPQVTSRGTGTEVGAVGIAALVFTESRVL